MYGSLLKKDKTVIGESGRSAVSLERRCSEQFSMPNQIESPARHIEVAILTEKTQVTEFHEHKATISSVINVSCYMAVPV